MVGIQWSVAEEGTRALNCMDYAFLEGDADFKCSFLSHGAAYNKKVSNLHKNKSRQDFIVWL